MPAIIVNQASDSFVVDVSAKFVDLTMIDRAETAKTKSLWKVVAGVLIY
jgi:hypothetical protein